MANATADLDIPHKALGPVRSAKMSNVKIWAGTLVALDASGFAVKASDTAALAGRVIGRAAETVDNSAGAAGDKRIRVEEGVFRYPSSGANKLVQADVGGFAYVLDDNTVVKAAGTTNSVKAGRVFEDAQDGDPTDTWWIQIYTGTP